MNHYEQKQEEHRQRLQARAERLRQEANDVTKSGMDALSTIPFGQPILVGHYSERNYRNRACDKIDRGARLNKESKEIERRAASVGTGGISSYDPDAVTKLKTQLEKLTKSQDTMKKANAALRKGDDAALAALGFAPENIAKLKQPDCFGGIGFPSFALTNNNANIRRIEKRIKELEARASAPAFEPITGNGWRCNLLTDDNRIAFYYDAIPPEATRTILKGHGFKWSPLRKAWVRMHNQSARYATSRIIEQLNQN